jgi:hypothetical protein
MDKDKYQLSKCSGHQRQVLKGHLRLLKVYFTGNKTILFKQIELVAYMTLSIFPCYYVHCMYVFHIINHYNCYAPCGSLIGQYSGHQRQVLKGHLTKLTIVLKYTVIGGKSKLLRRKNGNSIDLCTFPCEYSISSKKSTEYLTNSHICKL